MIRIPIPPEYIDWAKEETKKFDAQKTYNKFECDTNYIGILGERVLHEWMDSFKIPHEWVEFTKKGWESPDYIINGYTIDLKTSMTKKMWIQKPVFDYYVFARVNEDMKELFLISFIKKQKLQKLIDNQKLKAIIRGNTTDYQCLVENMRVIFEFFKVIFKEQDIYTKKIINDSQ